MVGGVGTTTAEKRERMAEIRRSDWRRPATESVATALDFDGFEGRMDQPRPPLSPSGRGMALFSGFGMVRGSRIRSGCPSWPVREQIRQTHPRSIR